MKTHPKDHKLLWTLQKEIKSFSGAQPYLIIIRFIWKTLKNTHAKSVSLLGWEPGTNEHFFFIFHFSSFTTERTINTALRLKHSPTEKTGSLEGKSSSNKLRALQPLQATEHPVERSPDSSRGTENPGSWGQPALTHYVGCFTGAPPLISTQEKTTGESDCDSEVRRSM